MISCRLQSMDLTAFQHVELDDMGRKSNVTVCIVSDKLRSSSSTLA